MRIADFLSMEDLQQEDLVSNTPEEQLELERQVIEHENNDIERDLEEHRRMVDTIVGMEEQNEVIAELTQRGELTRPVAAGFIAARRAATIALGLNPDEEGSDLVDIPAMESMISGVSLEEETKNEGMIKKAWEAVKKFIKTIIDKVISVASKVKNIIGKLIGVNKQKTKEILLLEDKTVKIIEENNIPLLLEYKPKLTKEDVEPLLNHLKETREKFINIANEISDEKRDDKLFTTEYYGISLADLLAYNKKEFHKSIEELFELRKDLWKYANSDSYSGVEPPYYEINTGNQMIMINFGAYASKPKVILDTKDTEELGDAEYLGKKRSISIGYSSRAYDLKNLIKRITNDINNTKVFIKQLNYLNEEGFNIITKIQNEINQLEKDTVKIVDTAHKNKKDKNFIQRGISELIKVYNEICKIISNGMMYWNSYIDVWYKLAEKIKYMK